MPVQGTPDPRVVAKDVRVDHGRGHVAMAEEFLDDPDVLAALQKIRTPAPAPQRPTSSSSPAPSPVTGSHSRVRKELYRQVPRLATALRFRG